MRFNDINGLGVGDGARTADQGAEMSQEDRETEKLRLENKRLIEKLLAQK